MRFPSPVKTALQLDFPDEDKVLYPWLKKDIRYYSLNSPLDEGAFAIPYRGYPCNKQGKPIVGAPEIVVKIPKVDIGDYTTDSNRKRLEYIRKQNDKEITHIRRRLKGCNHANLILDIVPLHNGTFEIPATVQLYLDDACNLDSWLLARDLRDRPASRDKNGQTVENWSGIADRRQWVDTALHIAEAIKDMHMRRVTHGDIHPGNVFLCLNDSSTAKLIDFGEAFIAMPDINFRPRNKRSYLAPERAGPRFPLNEQVDVYSFGMLLLYLATGTEREITFERRSRLHRSYIHKLILEKNSALVRDDPRILDIIGRSTARDPADRPRMVDIYEDLSSIATAMDTSCSSKDESTTQTLQRLTNALQDADNRHSPILMSLIRREMRELENVLAGLQTEMVEFYGTRDQSLRILISLFEHLQEGDSWTTATTLAVWQGSALGRDGSYASANIRAIKRGVAVRRTFVVSVAELGREFSTALAMKLEDQHNKPSLKRLGQLLKKAVAKYDESCQEENYTHPTPHFVKTHREYFVSVLEFMHDTIEKWNLTSYLAGDGPVNVKKSDGFFFGICPVDTLDKVGAIREDNPASLMHFANESNVDKQWLLVMTEMRGRIESKDGLATPHLLGVRVFKSVQKLGYPNDRILSLQTLMNAQSSNVSSATEQLLEIVHKLDREM